MSVTEPPASGPTLRGAFLYLGTSDGGTGAVYGFKIGSDDNPTAISGRAIATPKQPTSMAFSADFH